MLGEAEARVIRAESRAWMVEEVLGEAKDQALTIKEEAGAAKAWPLSQWRLSGQERSTARRYWSLIGMLSGKVLSFARGVPPSSFRT